MDGCDELGTLALELLPCGVVVADGTGRLRAANNVARVLLGLEGAGLDGVALSCEGRPLCLGDLVREHAAGPVVRRRLDLEHPQNGLLRATLTRAQTAGAPSVHIVVERAPHRGWQGAGRSDPVMAFAHELRNTLTPLREGVALLAEGAAGPIAEPQRRLLEGMKQDAERMIRLVQDMISSSRARASRIRFAAGQVDLVELSRDVARSFEAVAAKAHVQLNVSAGGATAMCYADRDLLTQALSNLVSNALKFTPRGGTVGLSVRRAADGEEYREIAIRDTGPGLAAEDVERLLARDSADSRPASLDARSGLGIGLSIVREIVEQHGGRLALESQPGEGSCFRVTVPAQPGHQLRWRLALIADGIRVARAVQAPLSIVEVGLFAGHGEPTPWTQSFGPSGLQFVEQCLEENLRPSDTVVLGEDSATLVLYAVDKLGAHRVADRGVAALTRLLKNFPRPRSRRLLGVGVASYPADGLTATGVATAARVALWLKGLFPIEISPSESAADEEDPSQ